MSRKPHASGAAGYYKAAAVLIPAATVLWRLGFGVVPFVVVGLAIRLGTTAVEQFGRR